LRNYNTLYIRGTDECSTVTEIKALDEKCTPHEIDEKYFGLHAKIYKCFQSEFDCFGCTLIEKQMEYDEYFRCFLFEFLFQKK